MVGFGVKGQGDAVSGMVVVTVWVMWCECMGGIGRGLGVVGYR